MKFIDEFGRVMAIDLLPPQSARWVLIRQPNQYCSERTENREFISSSDARLVRAEIAYGVLLDEIHKALEWQDENNLRCELRKIIRIREEE